MKPKTKKEKRLRRHRRIRAKIFGTRECPRLCVFRSNKHIYAQLIDDEKGHTLVAAREKKNVEGARNLGREMAKRALEKGIERVVFDRSGYKYHGRVKALAEGAKEGGLKF